MKGRKVYLLLLTAASVFALASCGESTTGVIQYEKSELKTVDAYRLALANKGIDENDVLVGSSEVSDNGDGTYVVTIATADGEQTVEVNPSDSTVTDTTTGENTATAPTDTNDSTVEGTTDPEEPTTTEPTEEEPTVTVPEEVTPLSIMEAYQKALTEANVNESDLVDVNITTKQYKNMNAIEVSFSTSNVKYRFIYNKDNSTLLESKINIMFDDATEDSSYITEEEAKATCLKTLNVLEENVTELTVKEDRKRDMKVFKVEFVYNEYEYEFLVNALTGNIVRYEISQNIPEIDYDTVKEISIDEAKAIAATYLGKTVEEVEFAKVKLHKNYYAVEYEVKLTIDGTRYEIKIDAITGEIDNVCIGEHGGKDEPIKDDEPTWDIPSYDDDDEDKKHDYDDYFDDFDDDDYDDHHDDYNRPPYDDHRGPQVNYINQKDALAKALTAVGISNDNVDYYYAEPDFYKHTMVYYVAGVTKDHKAFEVILDAQTGEVLDKDVYAVPDYSNMIDSKDALDIALKHSCFSRRDVRILDVKLEYDEENDIWYYEIEFQNKSIVYEYEINATTGEIISFDTDYE